MDSQKTWNIDAAKRHYRIARWGLQHFDINSKGHVVTKTTSAEIDLYELSKKLRSQGVSLPVLVRFPQILQQSLSILSSAFSQAIETARYAGKYIAAYPIKVNQQATVIQHFQQQPEWPIAFEVGSKAELLTCLGVNDQPQTIICNGYKDENYIRLALMGCLLGHEIVIVIESVTEFEHALKQSNLLGVQPSLGMRVRLSSIAKGNWQNTGGEHSKFGLTSSEVLSLVKMMQKHDAMAWMKMLHFHMGSQIPSLQDIKSGLIEGMHYFNQLAEYGVKFNYLNIGGGLAVDYEGGNSNTYFSMNYSIQEYANTVIEVVHTCCKKHDLAAPTIVSENGRAMTAHHAVLITNVIDAEYQHADAQSGSKALKDADEYSHTLKSLAEHVQIIEKFSSGDSSAFIKTFSEVNTLAKKLEYAFSTGELSLSEKAIAEKLVNHAYWKILAMNPGLPEEQQKLVEERFVAKVFCNFSLFQSTPDIWGLKQIFPIMPLHRLDECPGIKSRIYDLTCDSDGRIDTYVEADSVQPYLSLHEYQQQQDYVLGIFLVGAYQEILGDLHNLFGDTHAVNIVIGENGCYEICDEEPGDTVVEILSYLHIDTGRMRQNWLQRLVSNNVSEPIKKIVIDEFEASLNANSYLS